MALTEGKHTGEYILSEANGTRSREQGILDTTAAALVAGTVVGKITATGKLAAYDNTDTTTGLGTAVGILYANAKDATPAGQVTYTARDTEVMGSALTGLDAAAKTDLAALGIIVR